jgi:hypothetical protein
MRVGYRKEYGCKERCLHSLSSVSGPLFPEAETGAGTQERGETREDPLVRFSQSRKKS